MGGDHGPSVTIPASLAFLEEVPQARIIAVGTPERLESALAHVRSPAKDTIDRIHKRLDALEKRLDQLAGVRPARKVARRRRAPAKKTVLMPG